MSAMADLFAANQRDFSIIHEQVPDSTELVDEIALFMKLRESDSDRLAEERRRKRASMWNSLSSWLNRLFKLLQNMGYMAVSEC